MSLEKVVETLIEAGRSSALEHAECDPSLERLRSEDYVNRLHWRTWSEVTDNLSIPDCAALAKALTICEGRFRWCGGSAAAVIWVFRAIRRRDPAVTRQLADWILPRSENDWVPFGTLRGGAKSVVEFEHYRKRWAERRAGRARAIKAEQEAAARRRSEKRELGEQRLAEQAEAAASRREWLANFLAMTTVDQLRELATRKELHVNYFPDVFEGVDAGSFRALDPPVLQALLTRVGDRRDRRWRQLRAAASSIRHLGDSHDR